MPDPRSVPLLPDGVVRCLSAADDASQHRLRTNSLRFGVFRLSLRVTQPGVGGSPDTFAPYMEPEGPDDTVLIFESRFEHGNLRRATQMSVTGFCLTLSG